MAPREVKGSTEEREQFMAEVFRKWYGDPQNAGKDLSIEKANAEFRKKYGSMLRNKKAYEIRRSIKAQQQGHPAPGGAVARRSAARDPESIPQAVQDLVEPGSSSQAVLIEGTPGQVTWFRGALKLLTSAGLASAKVDHCTDAYCVVVRP
jgi:ribosomal protein S30